LGSVHQAVPAAQAVKQDSVFSQTLDYSSQMQEESAEDVKKRAPKAVSVVAAACLDAAMVDEAFGRDQLGAVTLLAMGHE